MKVLLIKPPINVLKSSVKRCCTPLGLAYIGAVLEKNKVDVKILDCYADGYNNEKDMGDGKFKINDRGFIEVCIFYLFLFGLAIVIKYLFNV